MSNSSKEDALETLLLHKHPEYLQECCQLINREWKRSQTARLRSLESSCDSLPTCLILVKNNHVIGHCKLTPIPSIVDACFVESVVIDETLRGKGYGSYLMKKAEEYCRCVLKLNAVYISTKGQEEFYGKLGYNECAPISIFGSFIPEKLKIDIKPLNTDALLLPSMSNNSNGCLNKKVYMNKPL